MVSKCKYGVINQAIICEILNSALNVYKRVINVRISETGDGINPLLGLFGLVMSPKSASHRSKHSSWHKKWLLITAVNFGPIITHAFHAVPSMGPIISVVNLQGRQNSL